MSEGAIRGKSAGAVAKDIAEGFFSLNPLVLKKFDPDTIKELYFQIRKIQIEIRGERFPQHDTLKIRNRNMRLQRIHNGLIVLQHNAKERKIIL